MLVFGVGNDSGLWIMANEGGRTVFLESSRFWGELIRWRHLGIDVRMVRYGTHLREWRQLLDGPPDRLTLRAPRDVAVGTWDVIFVDGPAAHSPSSPGRMKSIFSAAVLAHRAPGVDVIVHDCDREVERAYCDRFFPPAWLVREFERTRHYRSR